MRTKAEVGTVIMLKPSNVFFLADHSKVMFLSRILFVINGSCLSL